MYAGVLTKLLEDIPGIALVAYLSSEVLHGLGTEDASDVGLVVPGLYVTMAWRFAMTSFLQRLLADADGNNQAIFKVSALPFSTCLNP